MIVPSPLHRRSRGRALNEDDLVKIRHDFMCVYGWIPVEEFKKIKVPEMLDLYEHVKEELTQRYKEYVAIMRTAGAKTSDI